MSAFRVILRARRKEHADRLFPVAVTTPYEGPPPTRWDNFKPPHLRGFHYTQCSWHANDWGGLKNARDHVRAAALGIL
jgi:hypothetical protein